MTKMANFSTFKNKFILTEVDDYSSINTPLKTTGRIKYTCFDVSHSFLVFGATSGGLYVFKREPCTFIQLLPNKEGPITVVAISPDEKLFAFASQRGIACVLERTDGPGTRLLNRSTEHSSTQITALQWAHTSDQIFIGDSIGRLSVINVSLSMSKNIFQIPTFIFMQLDSGIVQVNCRDDRLLVSTQTHCYVCDTAKEQYRQIGTKPRDGLFGACYLGNTIFCARPGSRLWEVDLEGTVQSTHLFKQLLAVRPALLVSESGLVGDSNREGHCDTSAVDDWPEQSFNFVKLSPLLKFIFTFKRDGIYIFDPEKVAVVLWSNRFEGIIDARCLDNCIYIWTESRKLHVVNLVTLDKCLLKLFFRNRYSLCGDVLHYFSNHILYSLEPNHAMEFLSKLHPLVGLKQLTACEESVTKILEKIELASAQKEKVLRLDSGIYRIGNHYSFQQLFDLKENNMKEDCTTLSLVSSHVNTEAGNSSAGNILPEIVQSSDRNDRRYEFTRPSNGIYSQIPFVSSPDIIHDALLEIGYNVSGKFMSGTKTLKDKWQVLEGKLKLSTNKNVNPYPLQFDVKTENSSKHNETINGIVNGDDSIKKDECDDEEIVVNRTSSKKNYKNTVKFTTPYLLNICYDLEKLDVDKQCTMVNEVILAVLHTNKQYNEFIIKTNNNFDHENCGTISSTSVSLSADNTLPESVNTELNSEAFQEKDIKYFPFSQFLTETHINVLKLIFHNTLKSNELVNWLKSNKDSELVKNVLINSQKENMMENNYPRVLMNAYSEDVLYIDLLLSNLLIIFSEVIDPYTILHILNSIDLECTYLSWCTVMDRFQEGALTYFTRSDNGSLDENNENINIGCKDWPMPLLLNAMFLLLRLDQVEPVMKMAEEGKVPPSVVSYIILKLAKHLEESGSVHQLDTDKKCAKLFLMYISKVINKHTIEFNNLGLVAHLEECFILINKDLNYDVCHCGFPKINIKKRKLLQSFKAQKCLSTKRFDESTSQSIEQDKELTHINVNRTDSHNVKYLNIGEMLVTYFWKSKIKPDLISTHVEQNDENFWSLLGNVDKNHIPSNECLEHVKHICSVAPHLLLWLLKHKISRDLFTVRTALVLQLGYLNEFSSNNVRTTEKWEHIVALNCRIERGECCFCSRKYEPVPGINWSHLATIMLKTIGPKSALTILRKYSSELPQGVINKRFYQACMLTSFVESRVEDELKKEKVIDAVNFITSDSSCSDVTAAVSSDCVDGVNLAEALGLDMVAEPDGVISKLLDSKNHHWGTTVDLENGCCNLCSLSLGTPCLLKDTGLRIFMCGHGFHFVCLRVKQSLKDCPLCSR